jgi:hypothetical protein
MPDNFFSDDELSQLKEITELYSITKTLIIYSEELNNLESFVPPINELKDSHDHLMRVFSVKFGFNPGMPTDYPKKNIEKVFSHLYRAAFECLDYVRIFQKEAIAEKLDGVSNNALVNAFPEYYRTIRPRIEALIDQIPSYKKDKDIGRPDLVTVKQYYGAILEIKEHIKTIESKKAALVEYDVRERRETITKNWIKILILIAVGIIGAFISHILWP